jgi:hypothetical protein
MCDTYIDGIGYVCNDCQTEFKDYLTSNGIILETEGTIKRELKKFMKSEKDEYTEGKNINVDAFFKEYKKY